jgi:hypothetical protein
MPTVQEFEQLFREVLGPEVYNPLVGENNAQSVATKLGIPYAEAKRRLREFRTQAGKGQDLKRKLQAMGFSLEDMGYQDVKELGKSGFDQDRWAAENGFAANGWNYDWDRGVKNYVISSDPTAKDRFVPIDAKEYEMRNKAQQLKGQGFKTYGQQLFAQNMTGRGMDPSKVKFDPNSISIDQVRSALGNPGNANFYDDGSNRIISVGKGADPNKLPAGWTSYSQNYPSALAPTGYNPSTTANNTNNSNAGKPPINAQPYNDKGIIGKNPMTNTNPRTSAAKEPLSNMSSMYPPGYDPNKYRQNSASYRYNAGY